MLVLGFSIHPDIVISVLQCGNHCSNTLHLILVWYIAMRNEHFCASLFAITDEIIACQVGVNEFASRSAALIGEIYVCARCSQTANRLTYSARAIFLSLLKLSRWYRRSLCVFVWKSPTANQPPARDFCSVICQPFSSKQRRRKSFYSLLLRAR